MTGTTGDTMPETVQGSVLSTIFRNEENGYTVLEIKSGRRKMTAVGTLPPLAAGENVELEGEFVNHPQYGSQFKAVKCTVKQPGTLTGIENFLASGLIKGVGPATARTLVQAFGKDTMEVLSSDPDKVAQVKGIGKKRAVIICKSFAEQYGVREAMVYLQTYGISPALAVKISRRYGASVKDVMTENPYRLVEDIEGIGFQTADRIAVALGIAPDSDFRVQSGLKYLLSEAANGEGHTYLPEEVLLLRAASMLRVSRELADHNLQKLILDKSLMPAQIEQTPCVFLQQLYNAELETASRLQRLYRSFAGSASGDTEYRITRFEKRSGITLSENQRLAVKEALTWGLTVITGGPGTGKTTIINCILSLLEGKALLAAPTGRAAKRMSEATGQEAKTLHRLLEYSGEEGHFQRDESNPLDTPCVIVDEMSMVDIFLMRSLLRALRPGTRLILVGDADQLPSVGAGNVLGDILSSGVIPSVRLTDIFRQKNESMIVVNAHRINHGEMPFLNRKDGDFYFVNRVSLQDAARSVTELCRDRLPAFLRTEDPLRDIQVLTPTRKGDCGVIQLNKMLQEAMNPPDRRKKEVTFGENTFRVGDKVMHVKNDYQLEWETPSGESGAGVFNGDIGYVTAVDTEDHLVTVKYDDDRMVEYDYPLLEELDLAYALSVHKSQGSEFACVVMPVVGGPRMLLTRNLFYTALTRARRLVVLAGSENAIGDMVNNDHIAKRYTALGLRLQDLFGV